MTGYVPGSFIQVRRGRLSDVGHDLRSLFERSCHANGGRFGAGKAQDCRIDSKTGRIVCSYPNPHHTGPKLLMTKQAALQVGV
jgi:hypothetical protein